MEGPIINPLCAQRIASINAKAPDQLRFDDFAKLKTYGRDDVSRMKAEDLRGVVMEAELQQIKEAIQDDGDTVKVLRWMKRGLSLDYAVRKVQVDQEIALAAMCGQIR